MTFSENIKKFRLEKKLTQEQLAVKLGISPQAVSKWETSEVYPDGALLLPLAKALSVSLDELFGNDSVFLSDISRRIITLIHDTESGNRFSLIRDICWQIERGLFNCLMKIDEKYDPNDIQKQKNASYILSDNGFTVVSNGVEPFFALFPQPKDGFGHFLENKQQLEKIFSALSHADTTDALIWLYRKPENYVFEDAVLAKDCNIREEQLGRVMEELSFLHIVRKEELTVNNKKRVLFYSQPSHILIALFLIAREIGYKGAYSLQSHRRNLPFIQK